MVAHTRAALPGEEGDMEVEKITKRDIKVQVTRLGSCSLGGAALPTWAQHRAGVRASPPGQGARSSQTCRGDMLIVPCEK